MNEGSLPSLIIITITITILLLMENENLFISLLKNLVNGVLKDELMIITV